MATKDLILNFKEITKNDAQIAGGKGASLGEMTRAGVSVPPGFVILSSAFEQFLKETDLNVEIDAILDSVNHKEIHTVENASEKIQALILNAEMPQDINGQIKKYFQKLNATFVAVRSSATAEDSAAAAWAGQLDSFLNTTEKTLLENVKRCWASLFTPRAIFYRFEKGLHKQKISVAVVIQKMVESEVSGIAFSVHPVTEDPDQLIIEAGFGLGEAIVSGQITPDSYVVEKSRMAILDKNINFQEKALRRSPKGGNEWYELSKAEGESQVLTDKEILALTEIILNVENHYGFPVDVEWAREKGKFYIVQSRPITTLSGKALKSTVKISAKDYQQLFQIRGDAGFLLSSFFMEAYKLNKALVIFKDGMWKSFLPLNIKKKRLKEGLKLYGDKKKYEEFKKKLFDHFSNAEKIFQKTLKKKTLTKDDVGVYLANALEYHQLYSHTEFFYTDLAFENQEKNKNIKNNFKNFEEFKLRGREKLNKLIFIGDSYYNCLIQKIASQFHLPASEVYGYGIDEVSKLFDGERIDKNEIQNRRLAYMMMVKDNELKIYSGDEAENVADEFLKFLSKDNGTIKGEIAHKGKVKARAKVFNLTLDQFDQVHRLVDDMKNGEVLVAETTGPEIIVACHKASAIVTNQGGMMSHAAIVAREMNIPCIVGTRNATEIIKTGDLVEVDANKGVVRILEKAEDKSGPIKILSNQIASASLANQFIALSENQELSAPIRNLSIFVQTIGWNTKEYYKKYYSNETPFSLLITINQDEQVLFMQLEKAKQLSREIFRKYWKNNKSISTLLGAHEINKKRTDIIYKNLTYDFIESTNDETLIDFISRAKDLFCESVALTLFARDFDKEMCRQLLKETENGISQQRLDQLWDKGIIPISDSFETRRMVNLAELIKKNKPWDEIAELCQFFEANYNKIATIAETKKLLKEKYGNLIKNSDAKINLLKEKKNKVVSEHNQWLKTLTYAEKALVNFFQVIIRLRDERKDILAKSSLVLFKVAQKFFKEAKLSQDLIYLSRSDELMEGKGYLRSNKSKFEERKKGYTVLMNYDGRIQEEYSSFYQTRDRLEKFYLEKQGKIQRNEIIGQTGSPGMVVGKVKIIQNLSKEIKKFNEGDILVTGMTRPEFVPLMKKALAVVTDEGGITCHAAIVARELGIPCVIGTKIATQVLTNGDLVEVDADNGVVRILEKARDKSEPMTTLNKEALGSAGHPRFSKFMSREHSFFYASIWNEANRDYFNQYVPGTNVQSMAFLRNQLGVLEIYYDLDELERIFKRIENGIVNDPKILDKIITDFYFYWEKLWPYVSHKKKIKSVKELRDYYDDCIKWWVPMAYIFVIPDRVTIPKKLRDRTFRVRKETQEYSNEIDRVYMDFSKEKYPRHAEIMELLMPEEIYGFEKLTNKQMAEIKKRKTDLALTTVNGKSSFESQSAVLGIANALSKVYSREKTLFYFSMWNDSDRRGWKNFLGYEVKQSLFIVLPPGRKGSVWYFTKELADIDTLLKQKLKEDKTLIPRLVKTLDSNWKVLFLYLSDKKKIQNIKELHNYYEHLVDWWSAMNTAFTIPDMKDVGVDVQKTFLKYRVESEKYTEKMNKVMIAFWHDHFPELKDVTFCIAPGEVMKLEGSSRKKVLSEIRSRKNGCIMFNGKIYPIDRLDTLLQKNNLKLEKTLVEGVEKINGVTAYKGKVQGRVKKILSFADMKNFTVGEILITEMTNPEYLPIMKMAAAIVTDEGGVTCHAAIASRELKIPCIVGAKIATQVLKDGDLVEVDADNGVVRILESEKNQTALKEIFSADFPLMMGELTYYGETVENIPWSKDEFNFRPYCVFERRKDGLYYYYNQAGIDWKIEQAGQYDRERLKTKALHAYLQIENILLKEAALDKEKLKWFIFELKKLWTWWDCMWWMIEYHDKHKGKLDDLLVLRKRTERLAPSVAAVLRNSIKKILPKKQKYTDILLADEVLKNKLPSDEELKKRMRGCFYAQGKIFYSIPEIEKELSIRLEPQIIDSKTNLTGQVAYPGKAKGVVRIVRSRKDIHDFKEGEIIVSPTTTPDFLPAMKKSAAIISEHGGAICHAAITSRELKIPCVVGVKAATKILKDGDLVEVDANNGVVRILKRASFALAWNEWELEFRQRNRQTILFTDLYFSTFKGVFNEALNLPPIEIETYFFGGNKGYQNKKWKSGTIKRIKEEAAREQYPEYVCKRILEAVETFKNLTANFLRERKKLSEMENAELAKLWQHYTDTFIQIDSWFIIPWWFTEENVFTDPVIAGLQKYRKKVESLINFNEAVALLVFPTKETAFQKQEKEYAELLRAANEINFQHSPVFRKKAKSYLLKYAWMSTFVTLPIHPLSFDELCDRVIKSKEQDELSFLKKKEETKRNKEKKLVILEKIAKQDKVLWRNISWAREFGWILTASVENLFECLAEFLPLYEEIARRLGVTDEELTLLRIKEVANGLYDKESLSIVNFKERGRAYSALFKKGKEIKWWFGEEAENLNLEADKEVEAIKGAVTELRGVTASSGNTKGKVRIVLSSGASSQLQEGEILVTAMTDPGFVPAMKRAAAIVTDEGGLLSHAAIMSREFEKPCIVGTKIATRVLKTGDMVEVDADNGIVKILKV